MNKTIAIVAILLIISPLTLEAKGNCPSADPSYYEDCMIQNISSSVSSKKYNYAIDLLNAYEEWFRSQKVISSSNLAKVLSGKAAIYYLKGDYNESLKTYNESLKLLNAEKNMDKIAEIETNISVVLASMNRFDEALIRINGAERYYKDSKKIVDLSDVLFNKGIFYFFSNNFEKAYSTFEDAERLYMKTGLKIRYLSTQILKGIMKAKLGEYKESLYLCKNNMLDFSLKYYCIALAHDGLGNKEEAKKAYQRAVEKIDKNINSTLAGSGNDAAQALSEKYSPVFTDYLLFMLKNSIR